MEPSDQVVPYPRRVCHCREGRLPVPECNITISTIMPIAGDSFARDRGLALPEHDNAMCSVIPITAENDLCARSPRRKARTVGTARSRLEHSTRSMRRIALMSSLG